MINFKIFKPSYLVAAHVKYFYTMSYAAGDIAPSDRITPDGSIELNFIFSSHGLIRREHGGKAVHLSRGYVVARSLKPYTMQRLGSLRMAGACFFPWGVHALCGLPVSALNDSVIAHRAIFGADSEVLQQRMTEIADPADAIRTLESYIAMKVIKARRSIDGAVLELVRSAGSGECSSPGRLLASQALSERRMQQKFKDHVGFSFSTYQRLCRFNRALRTMQATERLTDVAMDCGYYDQSHFISEFREFAGVTPAQFRREKNIYGSMLLSALSGLGAQTGI